MALGFVTPNTFLPNTVADANQVNANFLAIEVALNAGPPAGALVATSDLSALNWYNFFNFGALVNGGSVTNGTAFATMLATMAALNNGSGGGIAYLPAGSFPIAPGPGSGYVIPIQTVFQGAGATVANSGDGKGGPAQTMLSMVGDGTLLFGFEPHTSGGVYFRNIAFGCQNPLLPTTTCINSNLWNLVAEDCVFEGWPTAMVVGLQAGARGCTFHYGGNLSGCQQVIFSNPECFVIGPGEAYQNAIGNDGGPLGNSFLSLQGTEHSIVSFQHIFHWQYGIDYSQSSQQNRYNQYTNLEMAIFSTAVRMVPSTSAGLIYSEKFTSCIIHKEDDATDGLPVVQIDANGGASTNINDIEFNGCTVFSDAPTPQANQYIYEIGVCSDWRIIGGYAGNSSPNGGAAIAITGQCGDGLIMGTNLTPSLPNAENPSAAQYAVLVKAAPIGTVYVIGANMRGYSTPIYSTVGSAINLRVINCPGYNDAPGGTIITSRMPTSGVSFSAQTAGLTPYYGPATIEVTGGTITAIKFSQAPIPPATASYTSPLTSGTFDLSPGQYCTIYYTGSPTFVMVGR